jgi:hypothetical protein
MKVHTLPFNAVVQGKFREYNTYLSMRLALDGIGVSVHYSIEYLVIWTKNSH